MIDWEYLHYTSNEQLKRTRMDTRERHPNDVVLRYLKLSCEQSRLISISKYS